MKHKLICLILCLLLLPSLFLSVGAEQQYVIDNADLMSSSEEAALEEKAQALRQKYALTDYGIQQVGETALPYLKNGDYYGAFDAFLDALPTYFSAYRDGSPIDGYADTSGDYYHGDQEDVVYYEQPRHVSIWISIVIGAVVGGITVLIMRACMNTKRPQRSAGSYLNDSSYHLRTNQDLFLYSNVTKTRIQQESSSSGGGGSSVHTSSSGSSHGGGGGKF